MIQKQQSMYIRSCICSALTTRDEVADGQSRSHTLDKLLIGPPQTLLLVCNWISKIGQGRMYSTVYIEALMRTVRLWCDVTLARLTSLSSILCRDWISPRLKSSLA